MLGDGMFEKLLLLKGASKKFKFSYDEAVMSLLRKLFSFYISNEVKFDFSCNQLIFFIKTVGFSEKQSINRYQ